MRFIEKFFRLSCFCIFACSCAQEQTVVPEIVPAVEVKMPTSHPLGIIGEVEPIYILPMKTPFEARIDTGAESSSIDVENVRQFERDGEKWVSFTVKNEQNGEVHRFEKKIEKTTTIKRLHKSEKRVVVMMDVKFGDQIINANFSLANREKFEYQVLVGRNILTGRAVVDTSLSHTLN